MRSLFGVRALQADRDLTGVGHAGESFRASYVAGAVLLLVAFLCPPAGVEVRVTMTLAEYVLAVAIFYSLYRRWGSRHGPPPRLGAAGFTVSLMALFFVLSGEPAGRDLSFWTAKAAVLASGVSTGAWLAVVASRRGSGFWSAVSAVKRLGDAARAADWAAVMRTEDGRQ